MSVAEFIKVNDGQIVVRKLTRFILLEENKVKQNIEYNSNKTIIHKGAINE